MSTNLKLRGSITVRTSRRLCGRNSESIPSKTATASAPKEPLPSVAIEPCGGRGNLSRQICLPVARAQEQSVGSRLDWTAPRRRAGPWPGTAPDPLCRSRSRDLEPCSDERAALRWPMLIFKSNLMVLPFSANGLHSTIDVSAAPLPTSLRRALLRNAYGSSRPSRCLSCISTISTPLLGVN